LNADSERDAAEIAGRLESMGARDVRLLSGGIDAWRDAGGAVEEPTQEQPIPEVPSAGLRDL
jgi:3-mercaptopyruvate sulfurtransferase SseA